jgi:hypothetical protein
MADQAELKPLFEQLSKAIEDEDYDEVVAVAEKVLRKSPGHYATMQCRCVAWIHMGSLKEAARALDTLDAHKDAPAPMLFERVSARAPPTWALPARARRAARVPPPSGRAVAPPCRALSFDHTPFFSPLVPPSPPPPLQQAYTQYRLQKLDEAIATLERMPSQDSRSMHLLAQVLYRQEHYSRCSEIYEQLDTSSGFSDGQTKNNLIASYLSDGQASTALRQFNGASGEHYELPFNAGCAAAQTGDFESVSRREREE